MTGALKQRTGISFWAAASISITHPNLCDPTFLRLDGQENAVSFSSQRRDENVNDLTL
jgi:hypothetical protein